MIIHSVRFQGLVRVPGRGTTHDAVSSDALQISLTECGRFVRLATPAAAVLIPWSNVADLHVTEAETPATPKKGAKK
jgi:hypothetical protein